jgi:NAD(P)H-dependent flavin oxidoreductase YrpB (nitropropane dioxygenase family)
VDIIVAQGAEAGGHRGVLIPASTNRSARYRWCVRSCRRSPAR